MLCIQPVQAEMSSKLKAAQDMIVSDNRQGMV